jgi:hypothetical protein
MWKCLPFSLWKPRSSKPLTTSPPTLQAEVIREKPIEVNDPVEEGEVIHDSYLYKRDVAIVQCQDK